MERLEWSPKSWEKEWQDWKSEEESRSLLRLAKILRRVLETREDDITQTQVKDYQLKWGDSQRTQKD